ncbi:jg21257 [Pararge aegeria aegeria]|uniref:Jg21257 protein n=1 Tax=Pararge aegeria aegeria TaxID=348720 RepID=A0A8S4RKL2_9NEOP|nr:jg21257 [Pararge aegeria aegeria]
MGRAHSSEKGWTLGSQGAGMAAPYCEAMRALGYPQPISLESFRNPNWELVEACLRWLAARVEPDAELAGGKHSVEQRVAMVTHATELFHSRANLKLNGKKLYGADGWAVRELLKVASLLRAALDAPNQDDQLSDSNPLVYDVSNRVSEIKQARALATDITAQGAFLYDLLAKEPENKLICYTVMDATFKCVFIGAGGGDGAGRWSRPRPATRTLAAPDDYADLIHVAKAEGSEGSEGSLGSSSESELRLASAHPGTASALSDNEF